MRSLGVGGVGSLVRVCLMACERVSLPGGGFAIVCGTRASRGQRAQDRCACGRPATLLCDWKVTAPASCSAAVGRKNSGTCDAPICASCATSPAPEKDLCPTHAAAFARWQAERRIAS